MTPEQYQRIGELYHAALELAPEARPAFLASACGGDDELRREVESLLRARRAGGRLYRREGGWRGAAEMAAQQQYPSLVGHSLSHYQVLSLLGAGGMGEVYLAEDTRLGRKVALKLLPAGLYSGSGARAPFRAGSARGFRRSTIPNILTIYEIGEVRREGGAHFIVTEFVEGETLRGVMRGGRLESSKAAGLSPSQVASALQRGARGRDRPPRHQAGERDGAARRVGQSAGLWFGEVDRSASAAGGFRGLDKSEHGAGNGDGDSSVICRQSRRGGKRWINARTSSAWALCSTRCSPGAGRLKARR